MKRIRYILLSLMLLAGGLACGPASAAALPSFAADLDPGRIDSVRIKTGEIVIDDSYFVLSSSVKVYTFSGTPASLKSLKKGMDIGFSTTPAGGGQSAVTKIVILP